MSIITRENLKQYILTRLGSPIQNIEISDDQLTNSINSALDLFNEYHTDATEIGFVILTVTDKTITEYTLTDDIAMVTDIIGDNEDFSIFPGDVEPVAFTNATYYPYLTSYDIVSTEVYRQRYNMVSANNQNPVNFDYNEQLHKLIIFAPEEKKYCLKVMKSYIENTDILNNKWLRDYAVALAKKQWGVNLMKYEGANLPGGATFNFSMILSEANEEIEKLETDLDEKYSEPLTPYIA